MSLYDQVINSSKAYLGPATEPFFARQMKYLKVEPAALQKEHLSQLAWLSKNAASAIMDETKAAALAKVISSL